ncbi:antimicrobial peptide resistance and lipid A acyl ation protein PagP [Vibrio phage K449]
MKTELKIIAKYLIVICLLSLSSFSFAAEETQSDWEFITDSFEQSLEESFNEVVDERTRIRYHFGGWSHHLNDSDYDYNENNKLHALEYQNWLAGSFVNSYYDRTWLVGYNFRYENGRFEAGLITALSYGYDEDDVSDMKFALNYKGFMPVLFPYIGYSLYNSDSLEVVPTLGLLGSALSLSFQIVY